MLSLSPHKGSGTFGVVASEGSHAWCELSTGRGTILMSPTVVPRYSATRTRAAWRVGVQ